MSLPNFKGTQDEEDLVVVVVSLAAGLAMSRGISMDRARELVEQSIRLDALWNGIAAMAVSAAPIMEQAGPEAVAAMLRTPERPPSS